MLNFTRTGMSEIDSQHETLIVCLKGLHGGLRSNAGRAELESLMQGLSYHVMTHLAYEEEGMLALEYPERESHFERHEYFREMVTDLQGKIQANAPMVATQLLVFLRDWILGHVEVDDVKYVNFIHRTNASAKVGTD
jgi:methyl-accepting chemotaxis protein/hemerythrin